MIRIVRRRPYNRLSGWIVPRAMIYVAWLKPSFRAIRSGLFGVVFARQIQWRNRCSVFLPDFHCEFWLMEGIQPPHPMLVAQALIFIPFHIALPFGFEDQAVERLFGVPIRLCGSESVGKWTACDAIRCDVPRIVLSTTVRCDIVVRTVVGWVIWVGDFLA